MYCKRLTVGEFKKYLEEHRVPDDALITCQSDEEGNSESVVMEVYFDRIGREADVDCGGGTLYHYVAGAEVQGFDEADKGKYFVTFRPMY